MLATLGLAGLTGCAAEPDREAPQPSAGQRGVLEPAAAHTELVAFDVTAHGTDALTEVIRTLGAPAAGVTTTVAVGASLFDGRFDLERPRGLTLMPSFRNDVLDPRWCHGDLLVQASAATRGPIDATFARTVSGVTTRWRIAGFHPSGSRNLFGFREGSGNPDPADVELMDRHVWVQTGDDEPTWCAGGTYQVVRLIRLATPTWDDEPTEVQERVFGRHKDTNAPLGHSTEHAEPDYTDDPHGRLIPLDAHIRRANPRTPDSQAHRILRRSHSFRDESGSGQIFTCFQRDIERGFATVQKRLAGEALERYLLPFGGGYYFVLPDTTTPGADRIGRRAHG
ncbi:Dyp-type peroxidase [Saccharothrix xinjiangensis]|uniref:Dyp-type peroxidase n=1 Tax=Saccharothrix xinjiangensis TaxID=204798 RepID=A0ABV9XYI7_9PSEU